MKCKICRGKEAECIPLVPKGIPQEFYYKIGLKKAPLACFECGKRWYDEKNIGEKDGERK